MAQFYDLIIVGGAFGGSLLGMIACRLGLRTAVVDRGRHPRFAIGESSTPLANLLLEELATRYGLPRLLPLAKWGTWQREYPNLPAGIKRGFTFYHHAWESPLTSAPDSALLVAASPNDALADTHWYRPSFDQFFAEEAVRIGVDYLDVTALETLEMDGSGVRIRGNRERVPVDLAAPWIVDASGPYGFLSRHVDLGNKPLMGLEENEGLFAHFSSVQPFETSWGRVNGAPYPADAAATHHVFPGGWIWVLPFNNGVTSAGVSIEARLARELRLNEGKPAWDRLLQRLPSVREQFLKARVVHPFRTVAPLGYRAAVISGPCWTLLPSTAGFVDPLLSTGFALTLAGIQRLAEIMERENIPSQASLMGYGEATVRDISAANLLIAALYRNLGNAEAFNTLLMLYFASVSYAEMARRMGRPSLAPGFLLNGRPDFWSPVADFLDRVVSQGMDLRELESAVRRHIESVDIGGWMDVPGRNCHPVRFEPLLNHCHLLGATRSDVQDWLDRTIGR